jgi:hypothetical protein
MSVLRRTSPGVVLGIAAIVLALAGTSYAATAVISKSSQVKNGSLTGADIKNRSLGVTDLSTKARNSLRGQTGPQGPAGAQGPSGPAGPAGAPGAPGVTDVYTKAQSDAQYLAQGAKAADADKLDGKDASQFAPSTTQPNGGSTTAQGAAPALDNTFESLVSRSSSTTGRFLLLAKVRLDVDAASSGAQCELRMGAEVVDEGTIGAGNADPYTYMPMMGVATRSPGEAAALYCRKNLPGGTVFADRAKISVVRLDGLD